MLPKRWKISFSSGVIKPTKMRFCIECTDEIVSDGCNFQINENKEIESNVNVLKRQAPNNFFASLF